MRAIRNQKKIICITAQFNNMLTIWRKKHIWLFCIQLTNKCLCSGDEDKEEVQNPPIWILCFTSFNHLALMVNEMSGKEILIPDKSASFRIIQKSIKIQIFGEMLQSLKLGKYHGFWNLSLSILFFKVSAKLSKYYPYDFCWPPPGSRVQRVGELPHLLLLRQRLQARPPQCSSPASLLSKVIFDTTFSHLSFIVSKYPCHYKGVFSKCLCLCVCLFGSDHVSSSLWSNVSKVSRIAL